MRGRIKQLKKLARMDAAEIHGRMLQSISSLAESHGLSSLNVLPEDPSFISLLDAERGFISSAELFRDHLRRRSVPFFFGAFQDKDSTIKQLRKRWPDSATRIVQNANSILNGRFKLLGFDDLSFGSPIDWHLEPISGRRAPVKHWRKIDYLDEKIAGDKKIIWELNRHQYFNILGQAYWLTNDERYAAEFNNHLDSWMDHNPPKEGINWASSLEVGFRAISWLWAFYFFSTASAFKDQTLWRALKFLYIHARHLETYLSTYFSPNTHLTGEALALFYLGSLLPEFKEASRWKSKGRRILLEQLQLQVRADGVYFEQSSYYHRYTADFYIHFVLLSEANGEPVELTVLEKLQALLDHLMYITRPDGTTPFVGDDDGGHLVMLDDRPANDFRSTLSNGAALFKRDDYRFVAGEIAEETLWLFGNSGLEKIDRMGFSKPAKTSASFQQSGFFVMRDGWSADANYLLLDCGPHGAVSCGHAHADALSLDLAANGRRILVDPGTYTYTGSIQMRNSFRGSRAHNCLTIDGESSSVPDGPFSWLTIAKCQTDAWISNNYFDFFEGQHDGYHQLSPPVNQSRSVLFVKNNYFIVRDRIVTSGKHDLQLWFHCDPQMTPTISAIDGIHQMAVLDSALALSVFGGDGQLTQEEGWVSFCYGRKTAAPVCVYKSTSVGVRDLFTFLLPFKNNRIPALRQKEAVGGWAFEVDDGEHTDLVLILDSQNAYVKSGDVSTNCRWSWARFDSSVASLPVEIRLMSGSRFSIAGYDVINLQKQVDGVVATRRDNQMDVEQL